MNQTYPPYSSCRINGKHLFQWAKEGKLDQITIPSIEIEIFRFYFFFLIYLSLFYN